MTYHLQWRPLGSSAPWKSIARVLEQSQVGSLQPLVIYNLRFVPVSGGVVSQWRQPPTLVWTTIGPIVPAPVGVTANKVYDGRISPTTTMFVMLMQGGGRLRAGAGVSGHISARLSGGGALAAADPTFEVHRTAVYRTGLTLAWSD